MLKLLVLLQGLLPALLVHLDVSLLEVCFRVLLVQSDGCIAVLQRLLVLTYLLIRAGPVKVECLIEGTIEWVKLETLSEKPGGNFKHFVAECLIGTLFKVLRLR